MKWMPGSEQQWLKVLKVGAIAGKAVAAHIPVVNVVCGLMDALGLLKPKGPNPVEVALQEVNEKLDRLDAGLVEVSEHVGLAIREMHQGFADLGNNVMLAEQVI